MSSTLILEGRRQAGFHQNPVISDRRRHARRNGHRFGTVPIIFQHTFEVCLGLRV